MRVDDQRRAEYARRLRDALTHNGGSLRSIAEQLGVSVETLRLNRDGKTVPATRARVRAQDVLLKTGDDLERVLFGDGAAPTVGGSTLAQLFDEIGELRQRVRTLEAQQLPAPPPDPADQPVPPVAQQSPKSRRVRRS